MSEPGGRGPATPASCWYTLGDVLREHALARRAKTAVVCGDVRLTWAELDERVDRLTRILAGAGVGPTGRVLWLGQNCHRLLELLLAAGRRGAACCPANWRQSADEMAFVIDDLEPQAILWQQAEIGDRMTTAGAAATSARKACWIRHDGTGPEDYEAQVAGARTAPAAPVDPESPLLILYTAAFEGRPKGVLLSHRALLARSLLEMLVGQAHQEDVYLNCGPLFHVGTLKTTLATFVAGGTNVFMPRVDPHEICRLIAAEGCTGAFLQAPTIEAMVEINADGRYDLSSLRASPGSAAWNAMLTVDQRAVLRGGYGQTELGGAVTYLDPAHQCIGSAGRPAFLACVDVAGPAGESLAPGEVGELVVRGPVVMTGYHRRAGDAERNRDGWHHTGDLGRREVDGSFSFVGPMTRIIKSAAENIYPIEVEACLRSHPAVADAAVIGVPDPIWGQSVKAIVVLTDEGSANPEELVAYCRERIASYKKPRTVEITDHLPRRGEALDYAALDAKYGGGGYPGTRH